jgi:hypothetical protein
MNNQMNIENVMCTLGNAIEMAYAENPKMDFMVFEDLHYDLCIRYKMEEIEDFERDAESRQAEADAAFYERFGHLGSI